MLDKSRRIFIKSTTYASALAITGAIGLSNLANANQELSTDHAIDTEIVTLINHTASTITLDNISGVAITDLNDENVVSIAAGEEASFIVPALSSKTGSANNKNLFITDVMNDGLLAIHSDYPEFNGVYPASVFATQVA